LLVCPCSIFFATNCYNPFPFWQATGTFEHHGCPCTSGEHNNNNNCTTNPTNENQPDNDGGEDAACAQGEAAAHQDLVAGASRGRGNAMGGDATTSQGKQEGGATRCNMNTRQHVKRLQRDKKPHDNKPGKWEVTAREEVVTH
jgi:hypothetical protein